MPQAALIPEFGSRAAGAEPRPPLRSEDVLRLVVEGTLALTGAEFFRSLVRHLATALEVRCALVTERLASPARVRAVAFWDGTAFAPSFEYDVADHPCRGVFESGLCHYPRDVREFYPGDPYLAAVAAESYLGIALHDSAGEVLGHVAVLDDRPMEEDPRRLWVLELFAQRAAAELERLRTERELQQRYDELRRLEESRERLAQMIVHDLRNPLVSVIGYLDLIENGYVSGQEARDGVRMVKRNAERLIEMVTQILDVAKLETGRMPLERVPLELGGLIGEVAADLRPVLERKKLRLEVKVAADLPRVGADRELVRRVLLNLASNAAAFSPQAAEIQIDARIEAGVPRISVRDRGPGVAPEDRARIFDRFGSVGGRAHGRRHSTGLGLAFCKLAVEAHGGAIGVESEPGRGSRFWFTLAPAAAPVLAAAC